MMRGYSTVQYSTVQYSTAQYSAVQHNTVRLSHPKQTNKDVIREHRNNLEKYDSMCIYIHMLPIWFSVLQCCIVSFAFCTPGPVVRGRAK